MNSCQGLSRASSCGQQLPLVLKAFGHTCRYDWRASRLPEYFPGRQAEVLFGGVVVGSFGIVHPKSLENFQVTFPVSALELNLEPFCFDQQGESLLERISCYVHVPEK